jgi:precorrin-3B synthase
MNAPMNAPTRRGVCPGLSAPMATGDGLLARLTPAGSIPVPGFAGLCASARRHGNGIIEITSRGSIQIRGLNAASAAPFATEVSALSISANDGIPVTADPLSGLDCNNVLDAEPFAAELRSVLASASFESRLSAKLSFVIDGGGPLHLDDLPADIRLRAVPAGGGEACFHVALGGSASAAVSLGYIRPEYAVECTMRLLEVLVTVAPQARMRDAIRTVGLDAFASPVADLIASAPAPNRRAALEPIGVHALRSGDVAIGIAPPFGHSDAETLQSLIDVAVQAGIWELRTAPKRGLLLLGVSRDIAHDVVAAAHALGFIVEASDPRRRVIACAGAPICSSGQIPARALAPAVAQVMSGTPGIVHISGCVKGCAYPAAAPMTIVGRNGACEVYWGDDRVGSVAADALPEQLSRLIRMRS